MEPTKEIMDLLDSAFREYVGVMLTDDQLRAYFSRLPQDLKGELATGGISDTYPRGWFRDWFSDIMIGEAWPVNGDGPEATAEFAKRMTEEFDKLGITYRK